MCSQSLEAPEELANELIECPTCKETIEVPPRSRPAKVEVPAAPEPPPLPPSGPAPSADPGFFEDGGITVTKTRFVVEGQTFALAGITSVRGAEIAPSRAGPIALLIVGVLLLVVYVGILMVIGAVVWLFLQKPTFAVVLTAAGGEVKAYNSSDRRFIGRVIEALTQAIIARG
jgi:hypothetical protein